MLPRFPLCASHRSSADQRGSSTQARRKSVLALTPLCSQIPTLIAYKATTKLMTSLQVVKIHKPYYNEERTLAYGSCRRREPEIPQHSLEEDE